MSVEEPQTDVASSESINDTTCAYYVPRKKRNCKMNVKSGKRFCGEHANFDKEDVTVEENIARMTCPFDSNQ